MYGLIGKKLTHSFSADFFNKKFAEEGIDDVYNLFPIPKITDIYKLIRDYPGLKGLNVTIPYKQEVISLLDNISVEAKEIGAVNVIKIQKNGSKLNLTGYNSDCIGFKKSLEPLLTQEMTKALILGTGGASKAVAYVLDNLGIKYQFVSRHPKENQISYEDLNKRILDQHLLIVNTTPLGTFPDIETYPSIPYQFLSPGHLCYDLVYNPDNTEFLKKAREFGASVKNGLEMLHLQAEASWEIWNNG